MINLAIDKGNSRIKFGVFDNQNLIFKIETHDNTVLKELEQLIKLYNFQNILVAATASAEKIVTFIENQGLSVKVLNNRVKVPFTNKYQTPKTLGVDRIALMAAAVERYPGDNVLVIDAGTCITYDLKTAKGEYLGGAIAPGLSMRFKALHQFTEKLPLIEAKDLAILVGKNTEEGIQSGVVNGIIAEIEGIIGRYRADYPRLQVVLTGGDAHFLSKSLKNGIFAHLNFLLEGLNYIMIINSTQ